MATEHLQCGNWTKKLNFKMYLILIILNLATVASGYPELITVVIPVPTSKVTKHRGTRMGDLKSEELVPARHVAEGFWCAKLSPQDSRKNFLRNCNL